MQLGSLISKLFLGMFCLLTMASSHAVVTCNVTPVAVQFGNIIPLSGAALGDGEVRVSCADNGAAPTQSSVSLEVKLSAGNSGNFASRLLFFGAGINASQQVPYNLYLDPSRTLVWGDGTSGNSFLTMSIEGIIPNGPSKDVFRNVYGRVAPISNSKTPGMYTDALTITVTF